MFAQLGIVNGLLEVVHGVVVHGVGGELLVVVGLVVDLPCCGQVLDMYVVEAGEVNGFSFEKVCEFGFEFEFEKEMALFRFGFEKVREFGYEFEFEGEMALFRSDLESLLGGD